MLLMKEAMLLIAETGKQVQLFQGERILGGSGYLLRGGMSVREKRIKEGKESWSEREGENSTLKRKFAVEIEKVLTPVPVDNEGSRPEKRQSSSGGPSMATTGLCLSPSSPTGSDVNNTGFPIVSSPNLYRPMARTGAVQVPPQQFEPSSKKDDPPTVLTLSLPRTKTYENEYESPPLDSAPHHNKVASPDNQSALTFAMPENPESMTFVVLARDTPMSRSGKVFGQRSSACGAIVIGIPEWNDEDFWASFLFWFISSCPL
ncbi:transcription factor MYB44-like [Vitis riparia]|uniref:transcription factor MYB44-like n=1 Tax=Vitis riparia TaxID=96939 RepID=UPI00155A7516|nr:transcription factor MYB44-like [Vitis riparia]